MKMGVYSAKYSLNSLIGYANRNNIFCELCFYLACALKEQFPTVLHNPNQLAEPSDRKGLFINFASESVDLQLGEVWCCHSCLHIQSSGEAAQIVESQTEFIPVASLTQFEEAFDFTAGFVNRQCPEKTECFIIESPYFSKPLTLQFPLLVSAQ